MDSGAGAAVGQGGSNNVGGNRNLQKTKNNYQLCLFLFSNYVDLKNNKRNYRKPFRIFWVREQLQKICFNSGLINHEITYDTVMKRHLCPRYTLLKGQGGQCPRYFPALRRPCS